ncbi:MAG TPA: hypothetical protein DCE65_03470 [Clostridiales bacterium]|nr:hypothetical protein [Clostridiales bacterium]
MKKYFEKTSIALIIAMMFILAIFGGEAMKTHTIDDITKYKMVVNAQGVKTENGTRTTTQVELGNYISLGKYNGKEILWRCVGEDENGALMLADNIIDTLPYDAKTNDNNRSKSHSRNYKRDTYGSNYWKDSNMRSWLNSTAVAGEVKWLCGNPPREDSVNGNAYDQKAGFLNDFSKAEIAAMKNVTQRSIVSHPEYNLGFHDGEGRSDLELNFDIENVASNFDSAYGENSTEKVFLLDVKQVNTVWKNFGNYYIGRNEQGMAWPYWLRTPVTDCNHDMRYVHSNGSVGREWPNTDYIGVRPAFYLDSDYYATTSGDGSASNPYVGSAPDKIEDDYTVAEPEEDPNQEWDISLDQQLRLTLGPYYSSDGKYATPTIPVYTIQKTRSDTENMVILICGEGYTKSQQQKFIDDVKKVWEGAMQYEPYRSYADRFNVYALCTASESNFNSGGSTFFDVVIDKKSGPMISVNKSAWKNHIFERCIGPTFLEQIHDAHIPNKTDPDTFIWDDDKMYPPFYYVHKYINQFAVLVNTTQDFGGSHRNYKRGIHYLITPADSPRAQKTFTHELGHGLLELGDEYMTTAAESTDYTSLNVAYTHDPEKVKWKQMLGFRKTFTCNTSPSYTAYNSSWECLMRDTTYQFCEVCKLQGSKRMSQLIDGKSLYVADPEVKKYTVQYSKPSDFADTTYNGYYYFENYRNNVLLSGVDKNKFNTSMAGEKIQLRTIVQNLSDTTQRYVTMKLWIKHAGGSVATTTGGQRLEATQTFTIPVWSEKSKFWPKGALSYEGSNMNSGLENCELIYQIPLDADLKHGDYVAFEVTDESGNILANDNTETQTYANINIEYKFEDGTPMPNANKATIPVAVGSQLNWTAPSTMFGHTFVRAEGHDQMVNGSGQTVTYYYTKQSNVHIHDWGEVKYTWTSDNTCKAERVCKHDSTHIESETVTATGTTITAATCKEKGKMKYTATFVNTAFSMQEKEVDIDFAEHTYGAWIEEVPATCIAGGMKAHYKCTVCGKYFDENKNETTEEALKTPVSPYYGHSFGFWVEEQYATCQAPGRKGYKHCSICNKDYDASNTEITDFVIPINPDGHELGDLVAEVPATCKDTGVKEHRDCRLCGKHCDPITRKEIADLTIPTTNNHTYGELIPEVSPTTTEFGVKEHKDCTVCGRHFDKDGNEITELRIAKIGTHNVIVNGESKFYAHGESVTVTANEPAEGKVFKGWQDASGKIVSTDKSYTFTVNGETTLTAVYEDKSSGGGEITPPAKKDGLSGGQIAGIVTGSAAVAGLGGFAVLWFVVKKKTFADLGALLKKGFTAIGNFFKTLGEKIKALFTKKK